MTDEEKEMPAKQKWEPSDLTGPVVKRAIAGALILVALSQMWWPTWIQHLPDPMSTREAVSSIMEAIFIVGGIILWFMPSAPYRDS
jgi:hypothetical protein